MTHPKFQLALLLAVAFAPLSCHGRNERIRDRTDQPVWAICSSESAYDIDEEIIKAGSGGQLVVGSGSRRHMLIVPANALTDDTKFTLEQVPGPMVQVNVNSDPHTTANPVNLVLSLGGCSHPKYPDDEKLQFYRLNPKTGMWEPKGGAHGSSGGVRHVTLKTTNFSSYVLAAAD